MRVELPALDLRREPAAIRDNRKAIAEAVAAYSGALKALRGFSHYTCELCGMGGG